MVSSLLSWLWLAASRWWYTLGPRLLRYRKTPLCDPRRSAFQDHVLFYTLQGDESTLRKMVANILRTV
jgi:hypothetical protein